jgi:hypothetical protein
MSLVIVLQNVSRRASLFSLNLMWFGNERCYRFEVIMFSGRYTYHDLPYRIHGQNAFLGQPGKEHSDRGHMLLNSCRRARVLFDVGRHRDRLDILQAANRNFLFFESPPA